jgi:hypothetical protein
MSRLSLICVFFLKVPDEILVLLVWIEKGGEHMLLNCGGESEGCGAPVWWKTSRDNYH